MTAFPPAGASPRATSARKLLLATLGTALAAGCASFDAQQREWIFQPSKATWGGTAEAAARLESVWIPFTSAGGGAVRLHGLWLPQTRADAPVMLYLHGARFDVRGSAARMQRMHDMGFAVLGIDYRGFGQSTDLLPSQASSVEDARAAWDWLAHRQPAARRFVFGHSLGGAVAVQLATEVPDAAGLMVEGTFTSIADVFHTWRWGWLPIGGLITQRFDSAARIAQVKVPVLVVHGSDDQLIRPELGRALFDRVTAPKRFVLVEGGSHFNTNAVGEPQYRQAMSELFGLTL